MVFASRTSQDFITPEMVAEIEAWSGRAVLEALIGFGIKPDVSWMPSGLVVLLTVFVVCNIKRLHEETGSVWEVR